MAALREIFAHLGFSFDDAKLKKANASIDGLVGGLQAAAAAFAGGAIVSGLNTLAQQLDVYDDLSAQTKIATKDLQALDLAAAQAGASSDEMHGSLTRLQMSMGKLEGGAEAQAGAFTALGIRVQDAAGHTRNLNDVLPEIFSNFSKLPSEAKKAEIATALFGRAGVRMIPTLDQGVDGLSKMRAQLDAVGGGASADAIKKAGEYRDAIARLDMAMFSLKGLLASSVFPILQRTVESVTKGAVKFGEWAKSTTLVDTGVKVLGATLAITLAKALGPYLGKGLKFAAIFLAIDDLLGFLEGKDSVIGRLLDRAFGPGSAASVRKWLNESIDAFSIFFGDLFSNTSRFGDTVRLMLQRTFGKEAQETIDRFLIWMSDEFTATIVKMAEKLAQLFTSPVKFFKEAFKSANDFADKNAPKPAPSEQPNAPRKPPEIAVPMKPPPVPAKGFFDFFGAANAFADRNAPRAPLPVVPVQTNTFNVKPQINVTVPAGTPQQVANQVAAAAASGTAKASRDMRAAHQALVTKGPS